VLCSEGEVRIPQHFGEVYTAYNELQRQQGYDLSRLRGQTVTHYTYRIANHPQGKEQTVVANLLVADGRIVGGDISSLALDGFMHGFAMPEPSLSLAGTVG